MRSGPDTFDKLRYVTTFLTVLGVTEILHSFRLEVFQIRDFSLLEVRTGKKMPVSSRIAFLEKFLGNNFALSDVDSRFTFVENTISNVKRHESHISGNLKNPSSTITSLSEL